MATCPSARSKKAVYDNADINFLLGKYASLTPKDIYYIENSGEKSTNVDGQEIEGVETVKKQDFYQGTELSNALNANCYQPFDPMVVNYLYIDPNPTLYEDAETFPEDIVNEVIPSLL